VVPSELHGGTVSWHECDEGALTSNKEHTAAAFCWQRARRDRAPFGVATYSTCRRPDRQLDGDESEPPRDRGGNRLRTERALCSSSWIVKVVPHSSQRQTMTCSEILIRGGSRFVQTGQTISIPDDNGPRAARHSGFSRGSGGVSLHRWMDGRGISVKSRPIALAGYFRS